MDALADALLFVVAAGNLLYGLVTGRVLGGPGVGFMRKSENDDGFWLMIVFWGVGALVLLFALVSRAFA